jgi:hypothetical protein
VNTVVTNTPRAGESAEQTAARSAPRGHAYDSHIKAKLAFLSQPSQGAYLINLQFENGANLRVEISKSQLANIVVDGARMALGERLEMSGVP